jgi:hypothetical protein
MRLLAAEVAELADAQDLGFKSTDFTSLLSSVKSLAHSVTCRQIVVQCCAVL